MSRPALIKHHPKPAEKAAEMRRQAVARERVSAGLIVMLDGLDAPAREATRRMAILALAGQHKAETGQGHAIGTLCRAVADLSPAYRAEGRTGAAEALFRKGEG